MYAVTRFFKLLTDLWIVPFRGLDPWVALASISFFVGLLATIGFRYFGSPHAIKRARNRLLARVLEIRIYKDDILGIFSVTGRILGAACVYIGQTLKPMAVMMIPIVLILVHCNNWFSYAPLEEGHPHILSLRFSEPVETFSFDASPGLKLDREPFLTRDAMEMDLAFTVVSNEPGRIRVTIGDFQLEKAIPAGSGLIPAAEIRQAGTWGHLLANGMEPPLPSNGPVLSAELHLQERKMTVAGYNVHWVVSLFVLSILFGLVLKRPLGAEF